MGILSRIKRKVRKSINSFSGEHSDAAPEQTIPYENLDRNAEAQDVEVVMARLNRPAAASQPNAAKKNQNSASTKPDSP